MIGSLKFATRMLNVFKMKMAFTPVNACRVAREMDTMIVMVCRLIEIGSY